jgi:hypothetical protein
MRHIAIHNTHPTVVTIDDTAGAFDAQGNPVTIDESLVTAEIARLQAAYDAQEYARNLVLHPIHPYKSSSICNTGIQSMAQPHGQMLSLRLNNSIQNQNK